MSPISGNDRPTVDYQSSRSPLDWRPVRGTACIFFQVEFNWGISASATVVAVVVAILFGVLELTLESSEPVNSDKGRSAEELINEIFGPSTDVERHDDTQAFAERIQAEAEESVNSVDRIHFNMHFVNSIEKIYLTRRSAIESSLLSPLQTTRM